MRGKKFSDLNRLDLDVELEMRKKNKTYEYDATGDFEDDGYYSEDETATQSAENVADLIRKEEEYIKKSSKFQRLFYFSAGTIIVCFLILIFFLASLLQKSKDDNSQIPSALYTDEEIENMRGELAELRAENEDLKNQILELTAKSAADYERPTSAASIEPEPISPVVELPKKYSVQPGDTLMAISIKFYGNQKDYVKIIEANDIEDETIFAGQILIIP
jgi:nucleoid-associated protein YgaU